MDKKSLKIWSVLVIITIVVTIAFPLNHWLTLTMLRHQLIEIPVLLFTGVIFGKIIWKPDAKNVSFSVSLIIFFIFSLIFWMLPKSIDLAVLNPLFNKLMNIHIFIAGICAFSIIKDSVFELKVYFTGMISAMLMAVGITLRVFNLLLCSSFSIEQQRETGIYLITIAIIMFIYTTFILMSNIINPEKN